jgi:response regulator RpfG family c-di-GMP phosphodiesterase/tRNA A-37 threonylcarbamoyl transferase component Bud32
MPQRAPSEASHNPTGRNEVFLNRLLESRLLDLSAIEGFLQERGEHLDVWASEERLGHSLVQAGLLTRYQLECVLTGNVHTLLLGGYRVLERLGSGGMGVVYRAEHCLMKRRVAVKVLPVDEDCPSSVRQRFYGEMRVLADLHHANVVLAFDAGEVPPPGPDMPGMIYLVMELIDGCDLDRYVVENSRLPVAEACEAIRQAACGLQAAHDRHLVHRDVKPSNLLRTLRGHVKLVDFGLARQFCSRLTDPRALLGSVEFMAPEQSYDPSTVGKEADIYGLGATLFWLLTGEAPYPFTRNVGEALRSLQRQPPRTLRSLRPDVPVELEALVAQMLDREPARRPPLPLAVMNALTPYLASEPTPSQGRSDCQSVLPTPQGAAAPAPAARHRVLIVDDEEGVRMLHRLLLRPLGCECVETCDGPAALSAAATQEFDLVLLDLNLPGMNGYEVCRRLRERSSSPHLKVIVVSGAGDQNALSEALPRGADDYVPKPFEPRQLAAKVRHALRLKDAQDRASQLAEQLLLTNRQLLRSLEARAADVRQAHNALLFAMAKMAESRDGETPGHLRRLPLYARVLAEHAADWQPWAGLVDSRFLEELDRCVPLHDIGKLGLPDDILLKPATLTQAERALVETHPLIGDRILESLGREHGTSLEFLCLARVIVRHHHERHDGRGYPDRLAGDAIPPAARLTAVADVYDALRRRRLHKPAMSHDSAVRTILQRSEGQFDPILLAAFAVCHGEFERIYQEAGE